jgi:hypothetical protein
LKILTRTSLAKIAIREGQRSPDGPFPLCFSLSDLESVRA